MFIALKQMEEKMTDFIGYYFIGLFIVFVLMIIINPYFWQSLRNSYFTGKKDINRDVDSFLEQDNKE